MLLKNCALIITQDKGRKILRDFDIFVEGGKIRKIAKNLDSKERTFEKIDCRGKIIIPSFINAHTHLPMGLLRGYKDDLDLHSWLTDVWKAESRMKDREYHAGAKFACLEIIKSGTSAYLDMYFGNENILKATVESGIRGYSGLALMDFNDDRKRKKVLDEAIHLAKLAREDKSGLFKAVISPHSVYTCSKELLLDAKKMAEKYNLPYTIHLSETRKEVYDCHKKYGKRPVEFLDSLEIIDKNFIGFHSAWLTKGEIAILGKRKASAVHCPNSNMKLATGGAFPYRELDEAGVTLGLGTDGACSNNSLNMLNEMKAACLMQKWLRWNACEMTAQNALDIATINGAKILRLNSGSIEEGKNADLVFFDKNHYSMLPGTDIVSNIVYSASREAITDLMVNGEFVMKNRKVFTMDEERVICEFENISRNLVDG